MTYLEELTKVSMRADILLVPPKVDVAHEERAAGEGVERKYLALYHMTGPEVSRSDAWSKAANTPWTAKMRPHFRDPLVLRARRYTRAA